MTTEAKKHASGNVMSREKLEIRFPSDADWAELVKDQQLSTIQADELRITILHVVEDLQTYRKVMEARPDRKTLVGRLKRMEKVLRSLRYECDRGLGAMEHFLPIDLLTFVGRSWTFAAMGEALGKNLYPQRFDLTKTGLDLQAIEEESRSMRQALGLRHGHLFLKALVDEWHGQLDRWLALDRLNQGGRAPQFERKYHLHYLAESSPGIIGKSATIAVGGRFVRLCAAVLPVCGISPVGVEKVVPGIVREMRASRMKQKFPS